MLFQKKWLLIIVLISTLGLIACQKAENAHSKKANPLEPAVITVYKVGTEENFAPFEFRNANGQLTGFTIDILKAIGEKVEFRPIMIKTPWENLIYSLNQGDIDIISASVSITEERAKLMDFSDPYFVTNQLIIQRQGNHPVHSSSLEYLKEKRIAVQINSTGDLIARKLQTQYNTEIIRFKTASEALMEVALGGAEVAISDTEIIKKFMKNNPAIPLSTSSSPDFKSEYYGFAVKKGNTELKNQINKGLKLIQQDGTYDAIYKKYFSYDI